MFLADAAFVFRIFISCVSGLKRRRVWFAQEGWHRVCFWPTPSVLESTCKCVRQIVCGGIKKGDAYLTKNGKTEIILVGFAFQYTWRGAWAMGCRFMFKTIPTDGPRDYGPQGQ